MPEPTSSSSVRPDSSDFRLGYGDDASSQTCRSPASVPPTPTASGTSSREGSSTLAEPAASSASSELVQKFSKNDYGTLIAGSATSADPPPSIASPSGPPASTVGPGQLNFQTGLPQLVDRGSIGNLQVTAKGDVLNVSAHLGVSNEDGSRGANGGGSANLANGEITLDYNGWSFSLGLGISLGWSIASGEGRDLDSDGVPERCFKMSLGALTLGECDEL